MKQKHLCNSEISHICQELSILLHAGVLLSDGLSLLAQEDSSLSELLSALAEDTAHGAPLSAAMRKSGVFPAYVSGLVEVGERSGRTEESLQALSRYYEQREQADRQLRAALTYPMILLLLMLVVIVVLLTQVLPVFNEVYASLGGRLTGISGGLLLIGQALNTAMPFLCLLLAAAVGLVLAFSLSDTFRTGVRTFWQKRHGDRGVSRALNNARFAQALAMGLHSGLPPEEAVDICTALLQDTPAAANRCKACAAHLAEGGDLAQALQSTGMLPPGACRLLALGIRSGSGDTVMTEIANRLSDEAFQALESRTAQVEPALVLSASLLVGAILLSVMLPLMNIMSAIG